MENITDNFYNIMRTEVLQSVHKAINVLNNDCTTATGVRFDDIIKANVEKLKNTINTFADEELRVYEKLFQNSKMGNKNPSVVGD